jgi:hypothetical protein
MVEVSENVRKFLKEFEEKCREYGGTVTKGTVTKPVVTGGYIDYERVACRFKENPPAVQVYVGCYEYPKLELGSHGYPELSLFMCFESSCVNAKKLDVLDISPKRVNVEEEERLCGHVAFSGETRPGRFVAKQTYAFRPEDELKGIVVYARGNQIAMELYQ